MKRTALAVLLLLSVLCLSACGGKETPSPTGSASPTPTESAPPSPTALPVSSATAVRALMGKWKNPEESYPYYYYFADNTYVYMHVKDENGIVTEVKLQYRANNSHLYITTDGINDESCVVLFHYTYIIKDNLMEMKEVSGGYLVSDEKILTKIS